MMAVRVKATSSSMLCGEGFARSSVLSVCVFESAVEVERVERRRCAKGAKDRVSHTVLLSTRLGRLGGARGVKRRVFSFEVVMVVVAASASLVFVVAGGPPSCASARVCVPRW